MEEEDVGRDREMLFFILGGTLLFLPSPRTVLVRWWWCSEIQLAAGGRQMQTEKESCSDSDQFRIPCILVSCDFFPHPHKQTRHTLLGLGLGEG